MALRSVLSSKIPVVIIIGATATGKTKLGVELAQKFGTEIISADSMQIYKGLDIVTAKASQQEREDVKHHLLDILEPHQHFTVVDFRNRALKIMETLLAQEKIPIIVGGTNYYIESIVYKILVESMEDSEALLWDKSQRKRDRYSFERGKERNEEQAAETSAAPNKKDKLEAGVSTCKEIDKNEIDKDKIKDDLDNKGNFTNEEIHARLEAIDPVMASKLHPNNRRKVLRSIEVYLQSGRRHSEILDEQKLTEGQLRMPGATIILWLKCEQTVHDERINKRVDSMLQEGLIEELLDFHARHNQQRLRDGTPPDYTKGIFQTLGFKEFHDYLMMSSEERNSEAGRELLKQRIENMKMATRRFARHQNKMILGRFLDHPSREVPPVYEIDTTHLSKWDEEVKDKAICVIESYLKGINCQYEPLKSNISEEMKNIDRHSRNFCEVCQRLIIGDKQYAIHLKSNRHMKVYKKLERTKKESTDN